jgi:hypothetical protein
MIEDVLKLLNTILHELKQIKNKQEMMELQIKVLKRDLIKEIREDK